MACGFILCLRIVSIVLPTPDLRKLAMTLAHPAIGTGFNNSTRNFLFLDFC